MQKKVYISGKITGVIDFNRKKFEDAEARLRERGYIPINPHKVLPFSNTRTWNDYMKADIKALMDCDMIAVLDDWKQSKGALIEVKLALSVGLPMMCAHTFEMLECEDATKMKRISNKHVMKEVKRELDMRQKLYPEWIRFDKINSVDAEHRIKVMQQLLDDLKSLEFVNSGSQANLF